MSRLATLSAIALTACAVPAAAATPSFLYDIEPILTRYGCNQGACHGKNAGQNGFRLSLRGYAPEWDHEWIAREFEGRRVSRAFPDESLLLLKPSGAAVHAGGKLFERNSDAYRVLRDWISAGSPGPIKDEPPPTALKVSVENPVMIPNEERKLSVTATLADGTSRDVTWLSQFHSNDTSVVEAFPDGTVKGLRAGETSVRVHFLGFVEPVAFTLPYPHSVESGLYAERKNLIDGPVFDKLAALRLPPSNDCDDETFVRRAYLDTVGRPPTPEEIEAFLSDASPDKRDSLADALLASSDFSDYWTLQLADLFQNRRELDHDVRGAKGVRAFHVWLRQRVAANRPWNEIAREVLTATGDASANPAVGYFIVTVGENRRAEESEAGSAVAQAFLGTRIGCAKCHNHPLERYTQDDYYRFSAFFARLDFDRKEPKEGTTTLAVAGPEEHDRRRRVRDIERDLVGIAPKADSGDSEASKRREELSKQLEQARKELEEAATEPVLVRQPRTNEMLAPVPLDRSKCEIPPGGDPRAELAEWMTDPANEYFAGAMVNRLWKHFFAVGLVEPVDDLRASNPPSNRPLWDALTNEFVSSGYDLRHMIRLILTSRAYQLASDTRPENTDDVRFYSHYYARRLPAEVFLDAVCQATGVPERFQGYPVGLRAVQVADPWAESYFLSQFGRPRRATACACERAGEVSLPQLLHMRNAGELQSKLGDDNGTVAALVTSGADDAAVADFAFLRTLGRKPTGEEKAAVVEAIKSADNRPAAIRDLFWALLNTKEFAFNH